MAGNEWNAQAYDSTYAFVARYGDDVLAHLPVEPGELVLDLGCGTGRHAAELAARGARVVGMDADEQMLDKARADHPDVTFVRADATTFDLSELGVDEPFTACFSNAALHWMTPQDAVLRNVRGVLAESGRFVAEMGGASNIAALDASLLGALADLGLGGVGLVANYFPTIGQQASALENAGFRVEMATWFRRPTPLAPDASPADWTRQFRSSTWAQVPEGMRAELALRVDANAEARGLRAQNGWYADYCRLRFVAIAI